MQIGWKPVLYHASAPTALPAKIIPLCPLNQHKSSRAASLYICAHFNISTFGHLFYITLLTFCQLSILHMLWSNIILTFFNQENIFYPTNPIIEDSPVPWVIHELWWGDTEGRLCSCCRVSNVGELVLKSFQVFSQDWRSTEKRCRHTLHLTYDTHGFPSSGKGISVAWV